MGRESKYYRHGSIFSSATWTEVPKGTESGFFTGKVISEADVNFSCEIYYITDLYSVLDSLAILGAVIISLVIVAEALPVVAANLEALGYYVKTFGIVQGLDMYRYLGFAGLPNGVISWLQMDMADGDSSLDDAGAVVEGGSKEKKTLYHYTNAKGMNGIFESKKLNPSLKANNPNDARYGDGQYMSDITPEAQTPVSLAKKFINVPNKYKYTHFIEVDVTDLEIIQGREGVFVIPNGYPLDLTDRIISIGVVGK